MSPNRLRLHAALVILAFTAACRSVAPTPTPPSPRDLSSDGLWERTTSDIIVFERSIVKVKPQSFLAFRLKTSSFDELLKRAPAEFTAASNEPPVIITLPRPDGTFVRFQVEESPIMESGLARRFPRIKTYQGRGLDDATARVRFERTPLGLHAMVLSASGAFLVDAIGRNDANLYVSYFKNSLPEDPDRILCLRTRMVGKPETNPRPDRLRQHPAVGALRVYRIAVAASHRYVEAIHSLHDPSDPPMDPLEEALIAINRTIDRVNLIFEFDVGVRLILVNDEPKIIYTDAGNDPYDDFANDEGLLALNHDNLKQQIGLDNFDVGHLFIVARGGVAAEPCACSQFFKGMGLSGNPHPTGNVFDVQYVSHEIGHQFGASHSFNGTTAGCQFRNSDTAYEPGSGSTIMGYSSASGICGNETIQSTADPYFHAISLKEIRAFLANSGPEGGDVCARKVDTGNRFAPEVNAGQNFTVPGRTPFALTVENSSDGDGDALIFTWEEFDRGPPDPPRPEQRGDHLKKRPLFRSWPSSLDTRRFFPALNFIMNPPTVYVAEAKPENNRTMVFRVTARDGRGRYGFDDVAVQVVSKRGPANVGPFEVTEPGVGASWPRGSTQTVKWSVGRTDRTPINCTQVRIVLVIRGDENHPIVLAQNVPNAGSTQITLPNNLPLTTTARIKVESVNNIFFNISTADIQIVGP
jgi:reprolysin-like metallo-peptidase family M12B